MVSVAQRIEYQIPNLGVPRSSRGGDTNKVENADEERSKSQNRNRTDLSL